MPGLVAGVLSVLLLACPRCGGVLVAWNLEVLVAGVGVAHCWALRDHTPRCLLLLPGPRWWGVGGVDGLGALTWVASRVSGGWTRGLGLIVG